MTDFTDQARKSRLLRPTDEQYIAAAKQLCSACPSTVLDTLPDVERTDDGLGAYVSAQIWVPATGSTSIESLYGGHWGEHPVFPPSDWAHEAMSGETRLGYWDWVQQQIAIAAEGEDDCVFPGP